MEALDASSNVLWSYTITGTSDGSVHTLESTSSTRVLTLSQPYTGSNNASIFIQSTVSGLQSVGITKLANNDRQVILDSDITPSVSLEHGAFTKPVYEIVEDTSTRNDAFLVSEVTSNDGLTINLIADNYDVRYYANDKDYIDGVVDINGD